MNYDANENASIKNITVLQDAEIGFSTLKVLAIDATGKEFELTRSNFVGVLDNSPH